MVLMGNIWEKKHKSSVIRIGTLLIKGEVMVWLLLQNLISQ